MAGQSKDVLNFCANNYLGLSSHPDVMEAARKALETHGIVFWLDDLIVLTVHSRIWVELGEIYLRDTGHPQAIGKGNRKIPWHG